MKKKKPWRLLYLLPVVLILALIWNGTCPTRPQDAEESLSNWMQELPDNLPVNRIILPGSHDAGTAGMLWLGRTQNSSIQAQLSYGARYFDLRVQKTSRGYPIYHSFMQASDFRDILTDIKAFILAHPSEVLLLDFQHFKGGSADDVAKMLSDELLSEGLLLRNDTGKSDTEFIRTLTLGDARGKCLIFFGETDQDTADWMFLRNNDTCTRDDCVLDSYYLESCHKGDFSSLTEEAHPRYFQLWEERQQSGTDGIFVLQCQLTDGALIFGPWSRERGQEAKMSAYIRSLPQHPDFSGLNVILRDFLTPEKCQEIIELNGQRTS